MSVVEGWIVEDTLKDKSANYGKQYPKGTFVTMMKVDNDEMWKAALKGEIKGFSIDALLGLQEVNFKSQIEMSTETKSIKEAIEDGFKNLMVELNLIKPKDEDKDSIQKIEEVKLSVQTEKDALEVKFTKQVEDQNKVIEGLRVELTEANKSVEEVVELKSTIETVSIETAKKDQEIAELKVALSKEPEVTAITKVPEVHVELTATGRLLEQLRKNKN